MSRTFNHSIIRIKNSDGKYDALTALRGENSYELAVKYGFQGTEEEWMESIIGDGWVGAFQQLETTVETLETVVDTKINTFYFTSTILGGDAWIGDTAPYTQSVIIPGILETDKPKVDLVASDTYSEAETQIEAYGYIYKILTASDSITVYATEKPEVSLPIQIEVLR